MFWKLSTPELPETKPVLKDYTWTNVAPSTYISKNGLVRHQREKNPLVLTSLESQCREISGKGGGK